MKYFLYARKSTEDKKKQIQSIDDQIRVMIEIAKDRRLEIVDTITDEKTAKCPGRKGFTKMIERIQEGEAEGILCWKLDRLARNMIDGGNVIWLLQEEKIKEIITPDKTFFPSENTLILNIEFGMATQSSRDLRKTVERGMQSKIDQGWFPGVAPIGYKNDPYSLKGSRKILVDPDTFLVLQSLWRKLLHDHCSLIELYDYMRTESPLYRQGKIFSYSSFHRIFHHKFYCGLFQWKGVCYVGSHAPMISQKEFDQAQAILFTGRGLRARTLHFDLKGLFRCDCCDSLITAESHTKTVKATGEMQIYNYYRCGRRKKTIDCKEKPLSETKLEEQILQEIDDISIPSEIIEFGIKTLDQMQNVSEENPIERQIKKSVETMSNRIEAMGNNMAEESSSDIRATINTRRNELKVQRNALEQDLRRAVEQRTNPHVEIKDRLSLILNAKRNFVEGTADLKKKIVHGLGLNWRLASRKLHYEPHFVSLALRKTKESLQAGKYGFELVEDQSQSGRSLSLAEVKTIWCARQGSNLRPLSSASWRSACVRRKESGAPGRVRTCDPQLRKLMLYPAELRAHM